MRRRQFLAMAPAVLATAACAQIPRTSPVEEVSQSPQAPASQGVNIAAQPPLPGGSPEVIVAGFLTAMASFQNDYAVARTYLTKAAALNWKPESGVQIYDSTDHKPVTTEDSASLTAAMVGTLDEVGRFTPRAGQLQHDFGMTKENGEWRIGHAPQGLLMARYLFSRYYMPVTLWFMSTASATCVPEVVHQPDRAVSVASVFEALLSGPSTWARAAVTTAIPADVRFTNSSVSVRERVAQVSLPASMGALPDDARRRVAAQVVLTLTQLDDVSAVQLSVSGATWPVGDGGTDLLTADSFASYQPVDDAAPSDLVAVAKGVVGRVRGASDELVPAAGPFGHPGWGDTPGRLDLSRDFNQVAVVNHDRTALWSAAFDGGTAKLVARGTRLCCPQVAMDGSVWVIGSTSGRPVLIRAAGGKVTETPVRGLPMDAEVTAFRLSPGQTQIALVVKQAGGTVLGMLGVRGAALVGEWRPMPVLTPSGVIVEPSDVAWVDPTTLLLLTASVDDPRRSVYRVSADGATVDPLGPELTDVDVISLAAQPRQQGTTAVALTTDGRVFRFEDRYRWTQVATKVTAVALAS